MRIHCWIPVDSPHKRSATPTSFHALTSSWRWQGHYRWQPNSTSLTRKHYNDVIMGTMASQITSLTIVCWTVYSGADQRIHQSSASLAFVGKSPVTGEFLAQMASNAENVSIWWRHYGSEFWQMSLNIFLFSKLMINRVSDADVSTTSHFLNHLYMT